MSVKIAVVVPVTAFGQGAFWKNVEQAAAAVAVAARGGAQLVCLPETYPGEWRQPVRRTPVPQLRSMARENGVYLAGGFAEPVDAEGVRCFNTLALIGPDGEEIGRYRRTLPAHAPWIYRGGRYWDFDWVPADELPVFGTDVGRVGMLICSELYSPELPRILALKGAEILLMPAGLAGPQQHAGGYGGHLFATWRTLVWARAIENLACTAVCSNVPAGEDQGMAMVCSPEDVLLEEHDVGVHLSELDLDRIRYLRDEQDRTVDGEPLWRTKPGVLRDWRRAAVLRANPVPGGGEEVPGTGARSRPA